VGTSHHFVSFAHKELSGISAATLDAGKEPTMARDQSGGATPSAAELAAGDRMRRKRLGEDGCPQDRPADQEARDGEQPTSEKPENEQPGFIDEMRGM
jgi:hypothetical protein